MTIAADPAAGGTPDPKAATPPPAAPSGASAAPAPPPKVDPPAPAAPVVPAAGAASSASRVLGENDPEPAAGERIEMTSDALRKRIERGTKASLKAEFGTDDPKVLRERLDRLATFEAAEEDRRKAALTREQQLEETARNAEARATAAEQRALEVEERQQLGEAEGAIKDALKDVIKPKFWRHVREDLAQHLADSHDPEKLDAMADADREKIVLDWAKRYVEENPEYAVAAPVVPVPAVVPPVPKVPLTNGVDTSGNGNAKSPPLITTGKFAGKTAAPGHPNSMSAAEFAQWKRDTGNNF